LKKEFQIKKEDLKQYLKFVLIEENHEKKMPINDEFQKQMQELKLEKDAQKLYFKNKPN
jgi:hypothetical protein